MGASLSRQDRLGQAPSEIASRILLLRDDALVLNKPAGLRWKIGCPLCKWAGAICRSRRIGWIRIRRAAWCWGAQSRPWRRLAPFLPRGWRRKPIGRWCRAARLRMRGRLPCLSAKSALGRRAGGWKCMRMGWHRSHAGAAWGVALAWLGWNWRRKPGGRINCACIARGWAGPFLVMRIMAREGRAACICWRGRLRCRWNRPCGQRRLRRRIWKARCGNVAGTRRCSGCVHFMAKDPPTMMESGLLCEKKW